MRGARSPAATRTLSTRIIPADAGSTPKPTATRMFAGDHPRGCGEHQPVAWSPLPAMGSSPRMRGAQGAGFQVGDGRGIIPADAGSTHGLVCRGKRTTDHPRGCGEHRLDVSLNHSNKGSSPRMRGAPQKGSRLADGQRIIPADAGSTSSPRARHWSGTDHPRGCGEHFQASITRALIQGSSPRMRGAPARRATAQRYRGIIPADAGSTDRHRDMPQGHVGSSPRMRGAHAGGLRRVRRFRIIPADAGSTPSFSWDLSISEDHPRGCGEHETKEEEER